MGGFKKTFLKRGLHLVVCLSLLTSSVKSHALATGTFLRDAEIESTLKTFITPIFKVAGLDGSLLHLYIIVNPEINAAASARYSIFINTGLLLKCTTPEQVIGVLAHETGHIAGGHLARLEGMMEKSSLMSVAALVLGGLIALKNLEAGMGTMIGGMMSSQGLMFHYSRGQEGSADSAGLRYLDALGWSAQGFFEFMKLLARQEYLSPEKQDLYMRTHPFSQDRVDFLENHLQNPAYHPSALPAAFYDQFARMIAKLSAYLDPPLKTLLTYSSTDQTVKARYARAIAYYRNNQWDNSLKLLDGLIQDFPQDPYFCELKAQFLFEKGRLAASLDWYAKALTLNPEAALIHLATAQVLLEMNQPSLLNQALIHLFQALKGEKENPLAWHLMATVQGRRGEMGLSALALAEEALHSDQPKVAVQQANRALQSLKKNADRLRAADIKALAQRLVKETSES